MKSNSRCLGLFAVSFMLAGVSFALAQTGAIVKQAHWSFNEVVLYSVAGESLDPENLAESAETFLGISRQKLAEAAKKEGQTPREDQVTISVQGKMLRADMESSEPGGKNSVIVRKDTGKMYYIMWAEKKYIEMSLEDLKRMREDVSAKMQQMPSMPNVEQMLESLPPEAREKARQAMKASGHMPGVSAGETKPEIRKTGKSEVINGMACEEYLVRESNVAQAYWVTRAKPGLTRMFREFAEEWTEGFSLQKQDKKSSAGIWETVPDGVPVVTRTFHASMMGRPSLDIQEIVAVEEKAIPLNTFEVPKDLTATSMAEMMSKMRGSKR